MPLLLFIVLDYLLRVPVYPLFLLKSIQEVVDGWVVHGVVAGVDAQAGAEGDLSGEGACEVRLNPVVNVFQDLHVFLNKVLNFLIC